MAAHLFLTNHWKLLYSELYWSYTFPNFFWKFGDGLSRLSSKIEWFVRWLFLTNWCKQFAYIQDGSPIFSLQMNLNATMPDIFLSSPSFQNQNWQICIYLRWLLWLLLSIQRKRSTVCNIYKIFTKLHKPWSVWLPCKFECSINQSIKLLQRLYPQQSELKGAQILSVIMCHNWGQSRFVNREPLRG